MATQILTQNWFDPRFLNSVVASSENSMLPIENTQDDRAGKVWETGTSTAAETVTWNLTGFDAFSHFAIIQPTNLPAISSVSINAHTSDSWGSPAFSETILDAEYRTFVHAFASNQSHPWWQFQFTKYTAGTAQQFGRFWMGPKVLGLPTMDFEGYQEEFIDFSTTVRTSEASFSDQRRPVRKLTLPFSGITTTQKLILERIFDAIDDQNTMGTHKAFLIQPDDTEVTAWYYVKLAAPPEFQNSGCSAGSLIWDTTLTVIEEPNP